MDGLELLLERAGRNPHTNHHPHPPRPTWTPKRRVICHRRRDVEVAVESLSRGRADFIWSRSTSDQILLSAERPLEPGSS